MGARLNSEIAVSTDVAGEMTKRQLAIPPPIVGHALLDTGADACCVDETEIKKLGLTPVQYISSHGTSGPRKAAVFVVNLTLVGTGIPTIESLPVSEADLRPFGIVALIGRNLLARMVLIFNGPLGHYSLSS
jgi:aspartyl protease